MKEEEFRVIAIVGRWRGARVGDALSDIILFTETMPMEPFFSFLFFSLGLAEQLPIL